MKKLIGHIYVTIIFFGNLLTTFRHFYYVKNMFLHL